MFPVIFNVIRLLHFCSIGFGCGGDGGGGDGGGGELSAANSLRQ